MVSTHAPVKGAPVRVKKTRRWGGGEGPRPERGIEGEPQRREN